MTTQIPRIELQPGYSISRVIKGGWQLAGGHGSVDERQAVRDMRVFVEAGVTTFDCADIYTGVEELIGKFIKQYERELASGELPPIQIHTKYVPDLDQLSNVTKAYTQAVIDRSLKRLGVERLDLVQFGWWDYSIPRYVEAAQHLFELQTAGKIRYIAGTNFDASHLKEILDAGVPIVADQLQYSVLDHRPEGEHHQRMAKENNLRFLCYGTVAGGFLSQRYLSVKEPKEPLENRSLVKYKLIIDEFGGFELFQEVLHALKQIADKYDVGIAEVAAQYVLQKSFVAGMIIGARNIDHLESIKKLGSLRLAEEDLRKLHAILSKAKGPAGPVYSLERDRTGNHGKIMRYNLNTIIQKCDE